MTAPLIFFNAAGYSYELMGSAVWREGDNLCEIHPAPYNHGGVARSVSFGHFSASQQRCRVGYSEAVSRLLFEAFKDGTMYG